MRDCLSGGGLLALRATPLTGVAFLLRVTPRCQEVPSPAVPSPSIHQSLHPLIVLLSLGRELLAWLQ